MKPNSKASGKAKKTTKTEKVKKPRGSGRGRAARRIGRQPANPTRFHAIRVKLDLTQRQMAERLGGTVRAVQDYEGGQRNVKGAVLKLYEMIEKGLA